jgi:hypothetical protein
VVWYLLLLVVPLAVGAYLLWDHRRKAAARAQASAARLNEILATTHVPTPTTPPPAPDKAAASQRVSGAPAQSTAAYAPRERVLTPPETLLYYLLKTGLPEYHVFAHVALRAVL